MKFTYTVQEKDEGRKIRDVIRGEFGFSSRFLRKIKNDGRVVRNGKEELLYATVKAGDTIGVDIAQEESHFEPEDIPLKIVYEDDDLLIVDKQPGIVVHPTKGHISGTLANALTYDMNKRDRIYKIRFVNRLDMDTSGLVIVAKNAFVQEDLIRQMTKNEVQKKYIAVVKGIMQEERGTIDLPIGSRGEGLVGRCVREDGERSITHFEVLERFEAPGYTLVALRLETGRTHQIRVHLSHIGHPIAGDVLYADPDGDPYIKRQALHAKELVFRHPAASTAVTVDAGVPDDIQGMLLHLAAASASTATE